MCVCPLNFESSYCLALPKLYLDDRKSFLKLWGNQSVSALSPKISQEVGGFFLC